jgi:hypothetical protein
MTPEERVQALFDKWSVAGGKSELRHELVALVCDTYEDAAKICDEKEAYWKEIAIGEDYPLWPPSRSAAAVAQDLAKVIRKRKKQ